MNKSGSKYFTASTAAPKAALESHFVSYHFTLLKKRRHYTAMLM